MPLPSLPALPSLSNPPLVKASSFNVAPLFEWANPDIGGGDYGGGDYGGGGGVGYTPPPNPFDPTGVTGDFGCDPIFGCPGRIGYGVNPIIGVSDGGGTSGGGGGPIISVGGGSGTGTARNASFTDVTSWFDWSRWAAFLLGLILVIGGLYLLKPVQTVVNSGVKAAKNGAFLAA